MAAPRAVALYSPPAPPRPVAMFNHCNNVTINGGTFILSAPEINDSDSDEDFRRIRLGDINLLKLIHEVAIVDDAVTRHREDSPGRAIIGVRKTYHAKIFPSSELFTVMSYEGFTSERMMASAVMSPRRPDFLQLLGFSQSKRMNALVYHNNLIPVHEAVNSCNTYLNSKLLKLQLASQFLSMPGFHWDHGNYEEVIDAAPWEALIWKSDEWLSLSTQQICVDLGREEFQGPNRYLVDTAWRLYLRAPLPADLSRLLETWRLSEAESDVLARLSLQSLLRVFENNIALAHTSENTELQLATVYTAISGKGLGCQLENPVKTIQLLKTGVREYEIDGFVAGDWIRFPHIVDNGPSEETAYTLGNAKLEDEEATTLNFCQEVEDLDIELQYFLTTGYSMYLSVEHHWDPWNLAQTFMSNNPPLLVHLWVPHPQRYIQDDVITIRIPAISEQLYWSYDPYGTERISALEAEELGLPSCSFQINIYGTTWTSDELKVLCNFKRSQNQC